MDLSNVLSKSRPKLPTLYWQLRAIEISQILGTSRTRWFRLMKDVSDSQADLYKEWATDIAERHRRKPDEPGYVRKPIGMFTDRVGNPAKYNLAAPNNSKIPTSGDAETVRSGTTPTIATPFVMPVTTATPRAGNTTSREPTASSRLSSLV